MAIGDMNMNGAGNTNNKQQLFENTYYSRLRIKTSDGKLALSPSFRSGLLILELSEIQEGFKYSPVINIHLSPTKARLFADEIDKFMKYYTTEELIEGKAFGVNSGMRDKVSFIAVHSDSSKKIYLTIGKFDGSGKITESATITLNMEYHFALEWEDIKSMQVSKVYDDTLELYQLKDLLVNFAYEMNGATAYSILDMGRYDYARVLRKMDPIFDKLGIERLGNHNNNGSRNSFLDSMKPSGSKHTTLDDYELPFGDDE